MFYPASPTHLIKKQRCTFLPIHGTNNYISCLARYTCSITRYNQRWTKNQKKTLNPPSFKVGFSNFPQPDYPLAFDTTTGPSTLSLTIPAHMSMKLHSPNSSPIPRTILSNLHRSSNLPCLVHSVFCLTLAIYIRFFQTKPVKRRLIGVDNGEERNSLSGQYARTLSLASF